MKNKMGYFKSEIKNNIECVNSKRKRVKEAEAGNNAIRQRTDTNNEILS